MKWRTYCSYQSSSSVCQDALCGLNWQTSYDFSTDMCSSFLMLSQNHAPIIKVGTLVGCSDIQTSLPWISSMGKWVIGAFIDDIGSIAINLELTFLTRASTSYKRLSTSHIFRSISKEVHDEQGDSEQWQTWDTCFTQAACAYRKNDGHVLKKAEDRLCYALAKEEGPSASNTGECNYANCCFYILELFVLSRIQLTWAS